MKPQELLLRCYANKYEDQWQIFCIDLCLASQADSLEEAHAKLLEQIKEYIYDVTVGEDRKYAAQLLRRKAPFNQIATFYYYALMHKVGKFKDGLHRIFRLPLPLIPQNFAHG